MHLEFEPDKALRHIIKCFWYERREPEGKPLIFEVQPDSSAEIIFYFGDVCSVYKDGKPTPLPSPFMMGLLNNPVTFYASGSFEGIAVRCFPWTVFDILGMPADKDQVKVIDHPIAQLQPKLKELIHAGNIEAAVKVVETYLLDHLPQIAQNGSLVKAGTAIMQNKGTISVSRVADEANATVRTLERTFKGSSGHTVKDVSALTRFEQVRNCLWNHPDTSLTALAHETGYTDQAHLTREFKRYTGTTPAAFARKRLAENK